jgi:hypothetical protein
MRMACIFSSLYFDFVYEKRRYFNKILFYGVSVLIALAILSGMAARVYLAAHTIN